MEAATCNLVPDPTKIWGAGPAHIHCTLLSAVFPKCSMARAGIRYLPKGFTNLKDFSQFAKEN